MGIWLEILVIAGTFINAIILILILNGVFKAIDTLDYIGKCIEDNSDITKYNLGSVYKKIDETREDMNRHLSVR